MKCPKCEFEQSDTNIECLRCGVIFSKLGIAAPQPGGSTNAASGHGGSRRPGSATRLHDDALPAYRPTAVASDSPKKSRSLENPGARVRANPEIHDPTATYTQGANLRHGTATGAAVGILSDIAHSESGTVVEPDLSQDVYYDETTSEGTPEPRTLDKTDWMFLGIGLAIAVAVKAFPLLNHIFMTMTTLVHEMGHTIFGWLFGYPSLPAFDLRYGGGVTMAMQRSALLLILFYVLCAVLLYTYRKNTFTLVFLATLVGTHALCSYTSMHDVVILFMGHGTELVIAGIFIYRALSGAAVVHTVERPLYAAVGLFIVISDTIFSYRLITSVRARDLYEQAKGGGHWMDFSRIAEDYLHVDLTAVALFFFLCCLFPPIMGFLAFRYQEYLRKLVTRMWARDPA